MLLIGAVAGCGESANGSSQVELGLLPGHNHSSETTLVAWDDTIAVIAINQRFESEDSFAPAELPFRRVAAYVSVDRGSTFSEPIDIYPAAYETTDPVIGVAADGTFYAAVMEPGDVMEGWRGVVVESPDGARTWTAIQTDLPIVDKEWLVVGDDALYVGAVGGYFRLARTGELVARATDDAGGTNHAIDGYLHDGGVRFLKALPVVVSWDGIAETAVRDGSVIYPGPAANEFTKLAGAVGEKATGELWIVHATRTSDSASVMLRVRDAGGEESVAAINAPGEVAFLPTAELDETGRLHVAWYDSSGERGVLRYTVSTDDTLAAFEPSQVIDEDACPGGGWYPERTDGSFSGRRLREYIGLTVHEGNVHIAWTHAPQAPSRVRVATFPAP